MPSKWESSFSNVTANHTLSASFGLAPTTPPTLSIIPNGSGGKVISWPDTYSATLLTTPVLGPNADWAPVCLTPVQSGGFFRVIIVPGGTSAFYALVQ